MSVTMLLKICLFQQMKAKSSPSDFEKSDTMNVAFVLQMPRCFRCQDAKRKVKTATITGIAALGSVKVGGMGTGWPSGALERGH